MSWRKPRVSWPSSCPIRKPAILPPKRKKPSQVSRLISYFLVFVSGDILNLKNRHHDLIIRVFDYNFKSSMIHCFVCFILLYRMDLTIPCRAWPFSLSLSLSFFVFCFRSSSKCLEFCTRNAWCWGPSHFFTSDFFTYYHQRPWPHVSTTKMCGRYCSPALAFSWTW